MEKFYTENVLIRYIYKEADFFERFEVEHAIEFEAEIREMYLNLCEVFNTLPKIQLAPSQNTLDKILAASR